MIHLFTLIKGDIKVSSQSALEVLKGIILANSQLAQQDLCFAVLTSFPFTLTNPIENAKKPILLTEATVGQLALWKRAKFFTEFLEATELHRWDYHSIDQCRLIDGVPVHITIVGTDVYTPDKYENTMLMEAEPFHRFCARYRDDDDVVFSSKVKLPEPPVCVVPVPDPFPPKPVVTYQEALEATHATLPDNPHHPPVAVDPDWVDRLIALFKGKGKKHV